MTNENASESISPSHVIDAKGVYTVQVADAETGQLKRTYKSDNYVTPMHEAQVKAMQAALATCQLRFPTDTGSSGAVGAGGAIAGDHVQNLLHMPGVGSNFIICTDSDEAEDTSSSWLTGNVTAYAPRVKITAASSGQKGLINETESNVSADGQVWTWVWDWSTTQGNGTFQSIGLGQIGVPDDELSAVAAMCGGTGKIIVNNGTAVSDTASATRFYNDGTDMWIITTTTTTPYLRWTKMLAADFNSLTTADQSGQWAELTAGDTETWFDTGATNIGWATSSSGSSFTLYTAAAWDAAVDSSGDIWICRVGNSGGSMTIHKIDGVTGIEAIDTTINDFDNIGTSYSLHSVYMTIIPGDTTYLYVGYYNDGDTAAGASDRPDRRRFARLLQSDGSFDAWVDFTSELPGDDTNVMITNLDHDGTNFILETSTGIVKATTAGAIIAGSNIGVTRMPYQTALPRAVGQSLSNISYWQENAVAPDAASYYWQLGRYRVNGWGLFSSRGYAPSLRAEHLWITNSYSDRYNSPLTNTTYNGDMEQREPGSFTSAYNQQQMRMVYWDGKLWMYESNQSGWDATTAPSNFDQNALGTAMFSVDGQNCFSRTLLDSAVTKSATETMKITYQLTLPADGWQHVPAVAPPNW